MEIISRKEAKEKGLKYYYKGKPCRNGHIEKRFSRGGKCIVCEKEYREKTRDDRIRWSKNWREKYPERHKQSKIKWLEKGNNKQINSEIQKKYRLANPERMKQLRHKNWLDIKNDPIKMEKKKLRDRAYWAKTKEKYNKRSLEKYYINSIDNMAEWKQRSIKREERNIKQKMYNSLFLGDSYIKSITLNLRAKEIPDRLIELTRSNLRLKRRVEEYNGKISKS